MWLNGFVIGVSVGFVIAMALVEYLKRDARTFFKKLSEDYWVWHSGRITELRSWHDSELARFRQAIHDEQGKFQYRPTRISGN